MRQVSFFYIFYSASLNSTLWAARRSFRQMLPKSDGIVYLVDAIDPESSSSSKAELNDILADEALSKPILVLVPKPDASGIANEETLMQELCMGEAIAKVRHCIVWLRSMYESCLFTRLMGGLPCSPILCFLHSSKDMTKVSQICHFLVNWNRIL